MDKHLTQLISTRRRFLQGAAAAAGSTLLPGYVMRPRSAKAALALDTVDTDAAAAAKKLAAGRNVPFIELDREIEKEAGMPLAEIFSLYGQSGYRAIERRTLERVTNEYDRAIFSIGGGVVTEPETYDFLRANCFTVWIKAKPQEHMDRVVAQGDFRAMAGNDRAMEDLRRILNSREPLYRQADMTLDTTGTTVDESFARLQSSLEKNSSTPAAKTAGGLRG